MAPSEPRAVTDPKAPQARPERRAARERKVPWVQPAETGSRVQWVCPVLEVPKAPPERTETREKSEAQDRRGAKATKEKVVLQVQQVCRA